MFIFLALFAAVKADDGLCYQGETNCLKCVDTDGCGFCRTDKLCYKAKFLKTNCTSGDSSTTRDRKCVAELGGDANPVVRYIVGTVFIIVAILVDLSCRFLYKKPKAQAFLKQIVTIE
ncbi:hypothetical protein M9Y10_000998 [Tritrichomonas musculus]|uniref:Uncharacterized protein n=1 Tax=Tritrichomonas musculus TaxID=1915356 RepID=A0ABR2L5S1_9EUKA